MSESVDENHLLLGEAKWSAHPWTKRAIESERNTLSRRELPVLPPRYRSRAVIRALFVPELAKGVSRPRTGPLVVTASDLLQ